MKQILCTLLILLLSFTPLWGSNDHDVPTSFEEAQSWWRDGFSQYIASGCGAVVPTTSLVLTAFACTGYGVDGGLMYYIDQAVAPITVPDSPTVWLAIYREKQTGTNAPAGWTGVVLTHYIFQAVVDRPDTPAGGAIFAEVTVAGSIITVVDLVRETILPQIAIRGIGANVSTDITGQPVIDITGEFGSRGTQVGIRLIASLIPGNDPPICCGDSYGMQLIPTQTVSSLSTGPTGTGPIHKFFFNTRLDLPILLNNGGGGSNRVQDFGILFLTDPASLPASASSSGPWTVFSNALHASAWRGPHYINSPFTLHSIKFATTQFFNALRIDTLLEPRTTAAGTPEVDPTSDGRAFQVWLEGRIQVHATADGGGHPHLGTMSIETPAFLAGDPGVPVTFASTLNVGNEPLADNLPVATIRRALNVGTGFSEIKGSLILGQPSTVDPAGVDGGQISTIWGRDVADQEMVNTTATTTLYTDTVAGGSLGTNRALRMWVYADYLNNSAGTATLQCFIQYGGQTFGSITSSALTTSASRRLITFKSTISANNATTAQVGEARMMVAAAASVTGGNAVITFEGVSGLSAGTRASASDQLLELKCLHSVADPLISLVVKSVQVELL